MKEYNFITPCDFRKRVFTESGLRYKDVYKPVFKDDGSMVLEVVDQMDQYEYIQVHKDSCDINKLLERFAETGDMSIFYQRHQEPAYADLVEMPKTFAELFQKVNDVTAAFLQLDPQIREKFNNSPAEWISSYGSSEFALKMGLDGPQEPVELTKVDEVNKDV